jgi:hypothetical protein
VIYDPTEMSGLRVPWDIPIEDFGFAFAMVTLAIMLWRRGLARQKPSRTRNHDHDQAAKR